MLLAPSDINNRGQVVGLAFSPDGILAFLWQNGVATNLGTLAPDVFSIATGINEKGQVVGHSCDADFSCRAFLWQDGTMTELNTLVHDPNAPFLENANSINSRGQIAGKTTVQGTPIADAFLATPSHGEVTHETAASVAAGERQRVASPEIRRMLRQRLGPRYHIPGLALVSWRVSGRSPVCRHWRATVKREEADYELLFGTADVTISIAEDKSFMAVVRVCLTGVPDELLFLR